METKPLSQVIARRRRQFGLSQRELARRTGVSQSRLSRLENGRACLSPEEVKALAKQLRLESHPLALPELKHPDQTPLLASFYSRPERIQLASEVDVDAWRNKFGSLALHLERTIDARPDSRLCRAFLQQSGPESQDEYQQASQFLACPEVLPIWTSPARCGFRQHPTFVRETGECAANLIRPCLHWARPDWQAVMLTQVCLRPPRGRFRLDYLIGLLRNSHVVWINLEVDGRGHDPAYDEYRRELLDMPSVRLSGTEVGRWDCIEIVTRRLEKAVGLR